MSNALRFPRALLFGRSPDFVCLFLWSQKHVDHGPSIRGPPDCIMWPATAFIKVKFALEQAMNAQRGSRGIALLFL